MKHITLEICCGSSDDVFQAKIGGADRVELNSSMFLGGITPSLGSLKIAKKAGIEILAMVRPREGGFCYTKHEFSTMLEDARLLLDAGADGIVFGFLNKDGTIDTERCAKMMEIIGEKTSVFHRAIDVVPDWRSALDALCELGVTRVLTSGQSPSVYFGAATIKEMCDYAAGRIEILPGAGFTAENAAEILQTTGCSQMHISLRKVCTDLSTSHNAEIYFGGIPHSAEDKYMMTDSKKVADLVERLKSL
ncbi:MAG: copper homeostasis protein CutC [Oscillospiraceae bacterium]